MFGLSEGALSGSSWVSMKMDAAPMASAARARKPLTAAVWGWSCQTLERPLPVTSFRPRGGGEVSQALSQILLEFECGHRPDIIMLQAQQTAEMR